MPATSSRAEVTTSKPGAYMRQLCKHFGHRTPTSFDENSGYIELESGRCELRAHAEFLELTASGDDPASRKRVEEVIGSHLERFGARDGLAVEWTAS